MTNAPISTKYLIIGASAAGISAANMLLKLDPTALITCVTAEDVRPYNKCFLVDWLAQATERHALDLKFNEKINLITGVKVQTLDVDGKLANLSNGMQISYAKVLLAIGAHPFRPAILGLEQADNLFTFHDYLDVANLAAYIKKNQSQHAVVIGAGLTGLECADALWRLGLQVTVVERSEQILGKLVNAAGADLIVKQMRAQGIDVLLNSTINHYQHQTKQIYLNSGQILAADIVILAVGVRPNSLEIKSKRGASLRCFNNYVEVDGYLQTNLADVWAAGDLIVLPDLMTGELVPSCSWPDAMLQGNYAAQNMFGKQQLYPPLLPVAKSHFFGLDFLSMGQVRATQNGKVVLLNGTNYSYQILILDQENMIQGALLIGDLSSYALIKRAMLTKQPWL